VHIDRQMRKACPFQPGIMQKIQAMISAAPECL
jgi:hypothetical protein